MGILLSEMRRDYDIKFYIILLVLSIVLCVVESYLLYTYTNKHSGFGIKLTTYIYSTLMIILLFSKQMEMRFNAELYINRIITYIGSISFALYLIHCYVITIIFKYINPDCYLVRWIMVLVCSILVVMLIKKIIPAKYHKFFGLV